MAEWGYPDTTQLINREPKIFGLLNQLYSINELKEYLMTDGHILEIGTGIGSVGIGLNRLRKELGGGNATISGVDVKNYEKSILNGYYFRLFNNDAADINFWHNLNQQPDTKFSLILGVGIPPALVEWFIQNQNVWGSNLTENGAALFAIKEKFVNPNIPSINIFDINSNRDDLYLVANKAILIKPK